MNFDEFSNFRVMGRILMPLELFTINFLEALPFRIWNYMLTASSGQKENENDFQTNEHIKKNQPKKYE